MASPTEDREFQELYPGQRAADLGTLYEPSLGPGRDRHVRVNMIASVDGGTVIAGTSGSLGGAADRQVFATIRSFADVIVVGAATVRAEHYGPPRVDERRRRARLKRGQAPDPAIALVTRNPELDWRAPFFTDADVPPLVITAATAPRPPAEIATIVVAGTGGQLDFGLALDELVGRGLPEHPHRGRPDHQRAVRRRRRHRRALPDDIADVARRIEPSDLHRNRPGRRVAASRSPRW